MAYRQVMLGQQRLLWEKLEPYGTLLSFPRHSLVYTPNEPAHSLYLLCSGQVNVYLISADGRVFTLQVVEKGHVFGHSVLAGHQDYDTFAETVRATRALAIPRERIVTILREHPELGLVLIDVLGHYVQAASQRLDEVAFKSVSARLASVLLDMAGKSMSEQETRLPRRTHQQLADMTNSYRETVTKIINQFRAAHLLDMDRSGITLLNPTRLREVAQGRDILPDLRPGRFCKLS